MTRYFNLMMTWHESNDDKLNKKSYHQCNWIRLITNAHLTKIENNFLFCPFRFSIIINTNLIKNLIDFSFTNDFYEYNVSIFVPLLILIKVKKNPEIFFFVFINKCIELLVWFLWIQKSSIEKCNNNNEKKRYHHYHFGLWLIFFFAQIINLDGHHQQLLSLMYKLNID